MSVTVTNTELKLESQAATLPRAARSGRSLPLSAATNAPSSNPSGQTDSAAAGGELSGVSGKRRSAAAQSYRMQTESSLAKMSAGKDSLVESSSSSSRIGFNKKESYTMMRFPSTPDIASESQDGVESMKNIQRPNCDDDAVGSRKLRRDFNFKAGDSTGSATVKTHSDDPRRPNDASDSALMPPPLSASVPLSYQATFIAKAAKHRRTTMPESLARSRELLAGAIAKHHRLSDSSVDGDDSPPSSSSSTCRVAASSKHSQDPSPLEPPERDSHKAQTRVDGVQSTDSVSGMEHTGVADVKTEHSDNVSSPGSSVTGSPKVVKIGRCVSPIRPHSASSTFHKRQLPPDPCSSVPVTSISSNHPPPLDSVTSPVIQQLSMTRSASAELEAGSVEPAQNAFISQSASACHLSCSSTGAVSQVQQDKIVSQQNAGKRPVASRTQTRLVLDSEQNNTENRPCTAQQRIINEIENFCAERRLSADRPSTLEVHKVTDHREHAANSRPSVTPVGHTRQQWEKTKQVEPFILESNSHSNSSISQSSSSVICDSLALADVSCLSKCSVNSVSSSSCLTDNTPTVIGSFSDSVISYGSTFQVPVTDGATDANSVQRDSCVVSEDTKCDEANVDKDKSTLSAIPSDM